MKKEQRANKKLCKSKWYDSRRPEVGKPERNYSRHCYLFFAIHRLSLLVIEFSDFAFVYIASKFCSWKMHLHYTLEGSVDLGHSHSTDALDEEAEKRRGWVFPQWEKLKELTLYIMTLN